MGKSWEHVHNAAPLPLRWEPPAAPSGLALVARVRGTTRDPAPALKQAHGRIPAEPVTRDRRRRALVVGIAASMAAQTPSVSRLFQLAEQLMQSPVQADSQQTPSTQKPVARWFAAEHGVPWGRPSATHRRTVRPSRGECRPVIARRPTVACGPRDGPPSTARSSVARPRGRWRAREPARGAARRAR